MLGGWTAPKLMEYCGWGGTLAGGGPRSLNLGKVGMSLGSQGWGASLKYDDWRHSSAVALLVGSYLGRRR